MPVQRQSSRIRRVPSTLERYGLPSGSSPRKTRLAALWKTAYAVPFDPVQGTIVQTEIDLAQIAFEHDRPRERGFQRQFPVPQQGLDARRADSDFEGRTSTAMRRPANKQSRSR